MPRPRALFGLTFLVCAWMSIITQTVSDIRPADMQMPNKDSGIRISAPMDGWVLTQSPFAINYFALWPCGEWLEGEEGVGEGGHYGERGGDAARRDQRKGVEQRGDGALGHQEGVLEREVDEDHGRDDEDGGGGGWSPEEGSRGPGEEGGCRTVVHLDGRFVLEAILSDATNHAMTAIMKGKIQGWWHLSSLTR